MWNIAAALGVGGFALAVFYYLQRQIVAKVPTPQKKWSVLLILVIIASLTGVVIFALHRYGPQAQAAPIVDPRLARLTAMRDALAAEAVMTDAVRRELDSVRTTYCTTLAAALANNEAADHAFERLSKESKERIDSACRPSDTVLRIRNAFPSLWTTEEWNVQSQARVELVKTFRQHVHESCTKAAPGAAEAMHAANQAYSEFFAARRALRDRMLEACQSLEAEVLRSP